MNEWNFQMGLRSGFGIDLEVVPTQAAMGLSQSETDPDGDPVVYNMTVSGFELRLPFVVLQLIETSFDDE
mgnify:CR=1 FL=1|jgi:hypothetical protein